jgi:hypothetical protein
LHHGRVGMLPRWGLATRLSVAVSLVLVAGLANGDDDDDSTDFSKVTVGSVGVQAFCVNSFPHLWMRQSGVWQHQILLPSDRGTVSSTESPSKCHWQVIKLTHTTSGYRMHSHEVKWGSGSGQQSVTAVKDAADPNSLWVVMCKHGERCSQGTPIKNGQTIRLTHLQTKRNLHSHHFPSPLSHQQEVRFSPAAGPCVFRDELLHTICAHDLDGLPFIHAHVR